MTGATITEAGTPASTSRCTVSSRLSGVLARGSMARASLRSSVVTDSATLTSPRSAIDLRMSRSRNTSADLVTMPTGWLAALKTSRMRRMIR